VITDKTQRNWIEEKGKKNLLKNMKKIERLSRTRLGARGVKKNQRNGSLRDGLFLKGYNFGSQVRERISGESVQCPGNVVLKESYVSERGIWALSIIPKGMTLVGGD